MSDIFHGCFVVTCTLSAFISLVWLREQILHGGGPDWLDQELQNEVFFLITLYWRYVIPFVCQVEPANNDIAAVAPNPAVNENLINEEGTIVMERNFNFLTIF